MREPATAGARWSLGEVLAHASRCEPLQPGDCRYEIQAEPDGTIPVYSPYAWSVPGAVDGWFELHHRFGKLPMSEVLAPAIQYAREGFPVSELIAYYWAFGTRVKVPRMAR